MGVWLLIHPGWKYVNQRLICFCFFNIDKLHEYMAHERRPLTKMILGNMVGWWLLIISKTVLMYSYTVIHLHKTLLFFYDLHHVWPSVKAAHGDWLQSWTSYDFPWEIYTLDLFSMVTVIIFEVNLTFEMLIVCGQQFSFSTHEWVFLWTCQSFRDRKCLDLRGTRTPNLRIQAECSTLLSYQGQTFTAPCFWILALAV